MNFYIITHSKKNNHELENSNTHVLEKSDTHEVGFPDTHAGGFRSSQEVDFNLFWVVLYPVF